MNEGIAMCFALAFMFLNAGVWFMGHDIGAALRDISDELERIARKIEKLTEGEE